MMNIASGVNSTVSKENDENVNKSHKDSIRTNLPISPERGPLVILQVEGQMINFQ